MDNIPSLFIRHEERPRGKFFGFPTNFVIDSPPSSDWNCLEKMTGLLISTEELCETG